jgi:tetratricopeptide (TPR) repeat protein
MRLLASHERDIESDIKYSPAIPSDIYGRDNDPAIRECLDKIDNEPFNYWLWHDLSRLYTTKNDLDKAIRVCQQGMEKWMNNPSPLMELSNLYAAKGDYKSAISTSMKLSKIDPILFRIALKGGEIPMRLKDEMESKDSLDR